MTARCNKVQGYSETRAKFIAEKTECLRKGFPEGSDAGIAKACKLAWESSEERAGAIQAMSSPEKRRRRFNG